MIVKGRGKFVGRLHSAEDGPVIIRIDQTGKDEFWLEIDLTQEEREALNPFNCPHCGPVHCDLRPTKETTGDK